MSLSTPCTAEASTIAGTLPSPAGMLSQQSKAPPEREWILMVCPAMCMAPLTVIDFEVNARRGINPCDRMIDRRLHAHAAAILGRTGRSQRSEERRVGKE